MAGVNLLCNLPAHSVIICMCGQAQFIGQFPYSLYDNYFACGASFNLLRDSPIHYAVITLYVQLASMYCVNQLFNV